MNTIITEIVTNLFIVYGAALIGALTRYALTLIQTQTKASRVKLAIEFAKQAVAIAETANWSGPKKKEQAMTALEQRLKENGLLKHFTVSQLNEYVESAVTALNTAQDKITSKSKSTYTGLSNVTKVPTSESTSSASSESTSPASSEQIVESTSESTSESLNPTSDVFTYTNPYTSLPGY